MKNSKNPTIDSLLEQVSTEVNKLNSSKEKLIKQREIIDGKINEINLQLLKVSGSRVKPVQQIIKYTRENLLGSAKVKIVEILKDKKSISMGEVKSIIYPNKKSQELTVKQYGAIASALQILTRDNILFRTGTATQYRWSLIDNNFKFCHENTEGNIKIIRIKDIVPLKFKILDMLKNGPMTSIQIVKKIHPDIVFDQGKNKADHTQYKSILRRLSEMKIQNIVQYELIKDAAKVEKNWKLV